MVLSFSLRGLGAGALGVWDPLRPPHPNPLMVAFPGWNRNNQVGCRSRGFRGEMDFAVGKAFRGKRVALRPTSNDGAWRVFFSTQLIVTIDLNR